MTWKPRQAFTTRASHGPIHRTGYIHAVFGICKVGSDWTIFHLPSGMTFIYSEWPTFRQAKDFAEGLLLHDEWNDKNLAKHPKRFNQACEHIASDLGYEIRKYVGIS